MLILIAGLCFWKRFNIKVMASSSLETTETEYLIKFSKNQFDMDFVRSIFSFINNKMSVKEASENRNNVKDKEEYNFSKHDYFSHLDEK